MPADAVTPFPFGRILVGLTRTDSDAELLRYADMLAGSAGNMEFQFVHVAAAPEAEAGRVPAETAAQMCDELAAKVRAHFEAFAGRVKTSCHIIGGSRIDSLLEFAVRERNDLVLIGHRRLRSGRRSMARRLAMKAPCSVWLVPAGSAPAITRVLGAVDFSFHSAYALTIAAALAGSRGLDECLSLHVHYNELTIGEGEPAARVRRIKEIDFQHFLRPLSLSGVTVRPLIEESFTVAAALASTVEREGADLVVMGTRGRSPSAAVLLGSESEQMIMETSVPALIVKAMGNGSA